MSDTMSGLLTHWRTRRTPRTVTPDAPSPDPTPAVTTGGPPVLHGSVYLAMRPVWPDAPPDGEPCWRDHCYQAPVNAALLCAEHTAEMRSWSIESETALEEAS